MQPINPARSSNLSIIKTVFSRRKPTPTPTPQSGSLPPMPQKVIKPEGAIGRPLSEVTADLEMSDRELEFWETLGIESTDQLVKAIFKCPEKLTASNNEVFKTSEQRNLEKQYEKWRRVYFKESEKKIALGKIEPNSTFSFFTSGMDSAEKRHVTRIVNNLAGQQGIMWLSQLQGESTMSLKYKDFPEKTIDKLEELLKAKGTPLKP